MAIIVPTVLAENPHQYREQIERVAGFAGTIHLDFADGSMTDTKTIELSQAWWPDSVQTDLHLMYQNPEQYLEEVIAMKPHRVIVHAEATLDFEAMANTVHQAGAKFGVALLPDAQVSSIASFIAVVDHV